MQWKTQLQDREAILSAPTLFLHDKEAEVEVNGQKYFVRYHRSLNSIFYRKDGESHYRNMNLRSKNVQKSDGSPEYQIDIELKGSGKQTIYPFKGETWVYTPASEQRRKAQAAQGAVLKSPMTGKVLKILAENGQSVKKGDTLLIIEAMKMENNIAAPADGTISEFSLQEGANLNSGELICKIKSEG